MEEAIAQHLEEMNTLLVTMKETMNEKTIRNCLMRYKELENQLKVFIEMWGMQL